ncbi:hypothetical protein BC832DRAFT_619638 [Gaertneriomyces semiglobifer]|nr:hypothetical protein BC832DRAFT_619638 [Gaertneriomyces semiglobifer]
MAGNVAVSEAPSSLKKSPKKGFLSGRLRSSSSPPVVDPQLAQQQKASIVATVAVRTVVLPEDEEPSALPSRTDMKSAPGIKRSSSGSSWNALLQRKAVRKEPERTSKTSSPKVTPRTRSGSNRSAAAMPLHEVLPGYGTMPLADFMLLDVHPRLQRRVLMDLEISRRKTAKENVSLLASLKVTKALTGKDGKNDQEKKKGLKTKFNALIRPRRSKSSDAAIFHRLYLAIQDNRTSTACVLLEQLTPRTLLKKHAADAERAFLMAMSRGMEPVCILMLDKGFPTDVSGPIRFDLSFDFLLPSYFIVAVALKLHNVARTMLMNHRVNVNATWYGLTALHICCYNGMRAVAKMLLDYGANLHLGPSREEYALFLQLKDTMAGKPPSDKGRRGI